MYTNILILYLSVILVTVNSARILAWFPVPSISHQVVFRPLTQELAKRGHEVIVLTPDPAFPPGQAPANLTEIDLHDMSYNMWREKVLSNKITTGHKEDITKQMSTFMSLLTDIFEKQYNSKEVQNVLSNKTNDYDLFIFEAAAPQALAMTKNTKVPVIMFSSLGGFGDFFDVMGAPSRPPLLYPTVLSQKINNLSLMDKLNEIILHYRFTYLFDKMHREDEKMMQKYFGEDVNYNELYNNIDLLFLNAYTVWEFNRPVPPGVVYLGGLHQKPEKELPKEWKSYLDSSKNGVIYVSFGTNVSPSHLPLERIQLLVKVFSQLPYDVLWKWDKDELPGKTDNIRIAKWLPQSDLLRHPNVKAFVTQCGLQSTDEAITAGVPLIGMPMLGDQWFNAEMYEKHKIGIRADLSGLTEERLKEVINTIVKDDSYRKNIATLRTIMHDQPQPPLERAVWWTEYVLRHGGAKHLRPPAANISWAEYLDLELLAAVAGIALTAIGALILVLYFVISFIRKTLSPAVKLKKN